MKTLLTKLWADEAGFLISGELVLVATILVLGMVVGLSEVSHAINQELEDVASAFGSVNQSYRYGGLFGRGRGSNRGSGYNDSWDDCDSQWDIAGSGYGGGG
jgi:Flp pilus assembly pilin Flp